MLNLSSETELLQVNGDRKGSSPSKTLRLVKESCLYWDLREVELYMVFKIQALQ